MTKRRAKELTLIFDKLRTHVISVVVNKRVHNFQTKRGKQNVKINNKTD